MSDPPLSADQWLRRLGADMQALLDETPWWRWKLRRWIIDRRNEVAWRASEVALMRKMLLQRDGASWKDMAL